MEGTQDGAAELASVRAAQERLIRAGLAERRRLEQTLHDETQQRLLAATAAIGLARLETDERRRREVLAGVDAELRAALDELRVLARELHPLILTRDGLTAALHDVAARSSLTVRMHVEVGRLTEMLEWAVYWLTCQALTAAEHVGARRAAVRLTADDDHVRFRWTHDRPTGTGAGLEGMADLVRSLGGILDVGTTRAGTTRIVAELAR